MGKKHPLDIFRTTAGGFDSASRDRRTLPGKVVASTPRPATAASDGAGTAGRVAPERSAPLISAARAAAAARAQERSDAARVHSSAAIAATPARTPSRVPGKAAPARAAGKPGAVNRVLLYSVLGVVGVLAVYIIGVNSSGTALKSSRAAGAAGGEVAIVAATWDGSTAGQGAAVASRDALRKLGFPDVRVVGYPSSKAGEFKSYDLLVGDGAGEAELAALLTQVRALQNGKGVAAFKDARIVPAPAAAH